ncbi:hypothetical protein [Nesterenkonia sp. F]|uniref:hypothetical protein n=1 Tax=Nesterenkonia sp. F TaxID=795955 RepID=UPI000255D14A|nr:hypothetical protein [Nesterenkonia sp. F]
MGLGDTFGEYKEKAGEAAQEAKEQGRETVEDVKEADSVGEGVDQVKNDAQEFGEGLKDKF